MSEKIPHAKFERRIAAACLRNTEHLTKILTAGIVEEDFENRAYRFIFREAVHYFQAERTSGKLVTPFILQARLSKIDYTEEEKANILDRIEKISAVPDQDCEHVVEELSSFARQSAFRRYLEELMGAAEKDLEAGIEFLQGVDFSQFGERKQKYAISDILEGWEAIQERRRKMRQMVEDGAAVFLKTGIERLDLLINGGDGVFGGEMLLVGGKTRRGKTNFAVNAGVHNLLQGLNILHFSTEDPVELLEDRYHSNLLQIPQQTVRRHLYTPEQMELAEEFVRRARTELRNRLKIVAFRPNEASILDVVAVVQSLKREGFDPDGIIFDPIDFFCGTKKAQDRRMEVVNVTLGFRAFNMTTMKPCLATTFIKAQAWDTGAKSEDVGESYDKGKLATYVVTINQNKRQSVENRCILFLDKNKNGPSFVQVPARTDFAFSRFEEERPEETKDKEEKWEK